GGIYCVNQSSPTIANCNISGNAVTKRSDGNGAGICCENYSSPSITNSTINENTAGDVGGGIFCINDCNATITNCDISENRAICGEGGGIFINNSSPHINHCTISDNRGCFGGGLYAYKGYQYTIPCAPVVSECLFSGNVASGRSDSDGGGMYFDTNCAATVVNCTVTGNQAIEGGGIYCRIGETTITNCVISYNNAEKLGGGIWGGTARNCMIIGNSAKNGGGLCASAVNCTIIGNKADYYGGGCLSKGEADDCSLTNCILWANEAEQGPELAAVHYLTYSCGLTVAYCDIQGGQQAVYVQDCPLNWGQGNIDLDPMLAFPPYDLHLTSGSPCIDAGTNTPPGELPPNDPDGNVRSLDGDGDGIATTDIGVYEFNLNLPCLALNPYAIQMSAHLETMPEDGLLSIRNVGGGTLYWEIVEDCPWLEVMPPNGASDGEIDNVALQLDLTGLTYGDYACELTVQATPAANSPQTVDLQLHVYGYRRVPSEYPTIQAAIDAAIDMDIVLVADGTYTGPGNKDLDFRGKSITVRGENGPSTCTIDCEGAGRGFHFRSGENSDAIVEGFTITNGNVSDDGGAIMCTDDSSPTIRNCIITQNFAMRYGGGIYCTYGSNANIFGCMVIQNISENSGGGICGYSTIVEGCTISSNTATISGGGFSGRTVYNSTITGNSAERGGGVYGSAANCMISNNRADYGGGCFPYYRETIVACTITGNSASVYGGGIYIRLEHISHPDSTIIGCVIADNIAPHGGGIYTCDHAEPRIINCAFSNNSASARGGAICCNIYSGARITNSILWDDSSPQGPEIGLYEGAGAISVAYCDVQGGDGAVYPGSGLVDWGEGNIDLDPMFFDPPGNLTLRAGSPCIDAGDNIAVPEDVFDIDGDGDITERIPLDLNGNLRFADKADTDDTGVPDPPDYMEIVDMGPYEYDPDYDHDGILNVDDNCPVIPNPLQTDSDNDGRGDACDPCPQDPDNDADQDGVCGNVDNCPNTANPDQLDSDRDGLGDACDPEFLLYVDINATGLNNGTSWTDAFNKIQDALNLAATNTTDHVIKIWVAAGTYLPAGPGGDRNTSFQLINKVAVYGGFAGHEDPATFNLDDRDFEINETILSSDLNGDDGPDFVNNSENSYHAVKAVGVIGDTILDGFTITAGNANGPEPDNNGGGILLDASSLTISNCTFSYNSASDNGGSAFIDNGSELIIVNCRLTENVADRGGGIGSNNQSILTLTDCTIINNSAKFGGGIYNAIDSNAELTNCVFIGNISNAIGGGMCNFRTSTAALTNCLFSGNSTGSRGGGMCSVSKSNPTITNCTFSSNSADRKGGAISSANDSNPVLANCILWGNNAGDLYDEVAQIETLRGTATVDYSCIQGWTGDLGGTGNHGDDPLFIDPDGPDDAVGTEDDNLRLQRISPCIDAGYNDAVPDGVTTDLDGNPRFIDGDDDEITTVDMGAYELQVISVDLDILPDDCPNQLTVNTKNKGRLPMAIIGTETFEVSQIDLESISINGTVFPVRVPKIEDVSTPVEGQKCECHIAGADGRDDVVIHFYRREIILALGLDAMEPGTVVPITVYGLLQDGTLFRATDCITLMHRED
ncbi:MAG: right-handed parallel beta-helix repeat-containing protein, partial [Planctomycetota bacterium]